MVKFIDKYFWDTIKFYVQHNPLALRYAQTSYSQFGEDMVLAQLFAEDSGFYVDVGAFHPYSFSNTYLFYRRGWSGINIEPNPHGFALLQKYRKRDININRAISQTAGQVDFITDRAYSQILTKDSDTKNRKVIQVETKPLAELLYEAANGSKLDRPIDFMSIDCEGHDLEVVRSNDWQRFRPKAVVIEDHVRTESTPIDNELQQLGYRHHCRLGMSKLFVDNSHF